MTDHLTFKDKIGILDPNGDNINPLNQKVYSDNYKRLAKVWSDYPAFKKSQEVLESLANNQLTFIIAGTGAGKTLIIPKLALHYTNYNGKIAMTLPKRVVTLSAATFSSEISDVELGHEIGYVFKGSDKKMINNKNKIIYMTDGYLAEKYNQDPLLSEYSIIIIDEAHERRIQIDLLLLYLKKILDSGKRPDLRVIIMSATIDGEKYQNYFKNIKSQIVNISGKPMYEIDVHFLNKPSNSYMVDGFELIGKMVEEGNDQSTLFFITTSEEALQLCRNIRSKYPKVYCIEVYADMDKNLKIYAESKYEYQKLGNYDKKLIMATNVAESSLTIEGLKYVIDSGYELHSRFSPEYMGKILEKRLISKAQALQRRGRVGRTEPGICYHLMTKMQFDSLQDFPTPDILRQDITLDFLKIIKSTDSQTQTDGQIVMNELMDHPQKPYVDISKKLFNLYQIIDDNDKLTKIGNEITKFSSLSLNRCLFLIYSYQSYCAREATLILAMLDVSNGKISNLFYKSDTICEADCKKKSSKDLIKKMIDKNGDHLSMLKIYSEFKNAPDKNTWASKYGAKIDLFNKVTREANTYYRRIINVSNAPQLARTINVDTRKKILNALKLSHKHLTAKNLAPLFAQKQIEGSVSRDSVIYQIYDRKELRNKKFIYDEFVNINGTWQFNTVTII